MTTTNLGLTLPTVGGDSDAWGGILNTDIGLIDAYLAPGQFKGTATNDSAAAGYVGEYPSSDVALGSATALVNSIGKTVTSISLTAGDWEVEYAGGISWTGATATAAVASISLTNNTTDATLGRFTQINPALSAAGGTTMLLTKARISLASTTTVYGVALAVFSGGSASGFGNLRARRAR